MNPIDCDFYSRSELYDLIDGAEDRFDVEEKTDPSTENSIEEENVFNPAGYRFTNGILKIDQLIGVGAFGKVYSGTMNFNGRSKSCVDVAIKINKITENALVDNITISSLKNEAMFLRRVYFSDRFDEKNIVRYVDSGNINDNHFAVITKICSINLLQYIKLHQDKRISKGNISSILQQTLSGLRHLHSLHPSIIHCDLKPSNILIDSYEDPRIRIADLGSSLQGPQRNEEGIEVVTRWYRSPEIALGAPFDYPSDLWSVGCIAYELATRQPLFPANDENELLQMHFQILGPITDDVLIGVKESKKEYFKPSAYSVASFVLKDEYDAKSRLKNRLEELNFKFPCSEEIVQGDYDVSFNRAFRSFIFGLLKWSPNRRSTIASLLQSDLIRSYKSENILEEFVNS